MTSITVRPLETGDAAAISVISDQCELSPWPTKDLASEACREDSRSHVATRFGTPLGFVIARIVGNDCEVLNIGVIPEARRQAVGATLLDQLLSRIKSEGIRRVYLEVRNGNEGAKAFYESFGFQRIGVRKSFYQHPTEDATLMELVLK